jgi:N-acetylmuramoyl-L-alanine amidase
MKNMFSTIKEQLLLLFSHLSTFKEQTVIIKPKEFTMRTVILDAGHGGMIDNIYQTKGKRSPVWDDGRQYYEGVGNRVLVNKISKALKKEGIKTLILVPEQEDTSLSERCNRANSVVGDSVFISVHSNAASSKSASGFEAFSYRKTGLAGQFTKEFYNEFIKEFPESKVRYGPKKSGKTANFKVLRSTNMPAVLLELFFMTNEDDCEILMSKDGQERIVSFCVKAIKKIVMY